jgi:DNA mismatch repair protein MutS
MQNAHSSFRGIPHSEDLFSLLWPPGSLVRTSEPYIQLSPDVWHDLGLDSILPAFSSNLDHQLEIAGILANLCQDPGDIRYRQDIIEDLLHNPQLANTLEAYLPVIDTLGRFSYKKGKEMNTLHEITYRMGELQSIVDCIHGLSGALVEAGERISAGGWLALREAILKIQADPLFMNLVRELPEMLAKLRSCASVTIGVNLDPFLRPVEATLLSVNEERFTSQSMLKRLFGKKANDTEGLTPLHSVPQKEVSGHYAFPIDPELGWAVEPMMVPLFNDLANVIEKTTQPIARQLKRYSEMSSRLFVNLRQDLIFYLGALRFIRHLREQGLPVCRPELVSREERLCEIEQAYNVILALHYKGKAEKSNDSSSIVLNYIHLGEGGRIAVLTGPNRGGKTTYLQGAGVVQALAQAGVFVPGKQARISPVDTIYTHFPIEEKPDNKTGRFGEEAQRLGEIFLKVTRYSLVLLNESLASTNVGESLYLAQDLLRILRRIGVRAFYSTHMHELGEQVDQLNADTKGDSLIVSLVSSPVDEIPTGEDAAKRNYKIEERPPLGRSYAREIAERYGISFEQLEKTLTERGILK